MITDIPTPSEFHAAGLSHLQLAWEITIRVILDWEERQSHDVADDFGEADPTDAFRAYWIKSQPIMANSLSLLLQAMEMALKGRIAAVSPFLLISRDSTEWPSGTDGEPTPFGKFRTLDASDLVKVCNTVSTNSLSDRFITFWHRIRVERNNVVHTARYVFIDPAHILRSIMTASQALFSETSWPKHIIAMIENDRYSLLGLDESNHNYVMRQVEVAISYLEPAEARLFFGFDKGRRSYVCPLCYHQASRDSQISWPRLAQLRSRSAKEKYLGCVVCSEVVEVDRVPCVSPDCHGNVVKDGVCLTCVAEQDDPCIPYLNESRMSESGGHLYHFVYTRGNTEALDNRHLKTDEDAIEDARQRMEARHAASWVEVWIKRDGGRSSSSLDVGKWIRDGSTLVWKEHVA